MSYFSTFSLVRYNKELQINLTRRVSIDESFKNDPAVYYMYDIQDTDTPENVSDRFYDDPQLSWVVLQFNDIINVFEEWPRSQYELEQYINSKYDDPYAIHHYEHMATGEYACASLTPSYDRLPITNYEYELQLNNDKRSIKLLLPELVGDLVYRHKELMKQGV